MAWSPHDRAIPAGFCPNAAISAGPARKQENPALRKAKSSGTDNFIWGNDFRSYIMSNTFKVFGVLAALVTLSACGETDMERTATGAVMGAAVAAVTGENVANGALIGGSIGAVSCSVSPTAPNCI
jgi:osmotically inducible lipoprotein OsmB